MSEMTVAELLALFGEEYAKEDYYSLIPITQELKRRITKGLEKKEQPMLKKSKEEENREKGLIKFRFFNKDSYQDAWAMNENDAFNMVCYPQYYGKPEGPIPYEPWERTALEADSSCVVVTL